MAQKVETATHIILSQGLITQVLSPAAIANRLTLDDFWHALHEVAMRALTLIVSTRFSLSGPEDVTVDPAEYRRLAFSAVIHQIT